MLPSIICRSPTSSTYPPTHPPTYHLLRCLLYVTCCPHAASATATRIHICTGICPSSCAHPGLTEIWKEICYAMTIVRCLFMAAGRCLLHDRVCVMCGMTGVCVRCVLSNMCALYVIRHVCVVCCMASAPTFTTGVRYMLSSRCALYIIRHVFDGVRCMLRNKFAYFMTGVRYWHDRCAVCVIL
jgi:hypothetical protein